ncbi:MAG TPA: hypothetical protein VEV45_21055 [Streptosporangiaceae bacterium]|nr:hypothetical protein [Streptosporangiaceae bacterium]
MSVAADLAFDPAEPRDPLGRWRSLVADADAIEHLPRGVTLKSATKPQLQRALARKRRANRDAAIRQERGFGPPPLGPRGRQHAQWASQQYPRVGPRGTTWSNAPPGGPPKA